MAAAGCSRYSAAKGRQFRLAFPQDDSNDSDDRRQYSGPVLFQRYIAQTRETVESNEQSIDSNVENAASQIHPTRCQVARWKMKRKLLKLVRRVEGPKLHVCCSCPPSCFHSPLPPRQKFLHVDQTKSCFAF